MQRGDEALETLASASTDSRRERLAVAGYLHDEVIPPLSAALMQVGLIDTSTHPDLEQLEASVHQAGLAVRRLMEALDVADPSVR